MCANARRRRLQRGPGVGRRRDAAAARPRRLRGRASGPRSAPGSATTCRSSCPTASGGRGAGASSTWRSASRGCCRSRTCAACRRTRRPRDADDGPRAVADEIASAAELALGKTAGRPVAARARARSPPRGEGSIRDTPASPRGDTTSSADRRRTRVADRRSRAAARMRRPGRATLQRMKAGLQISSFTWPGGPGGHRPDARPDRPRRRRRRLRLHLGDGPLLPDPGRRPARGADARGLDDARVHGRALDARPPGPDGRRRPLPAARPVGQGGDDARRAVRRPRVAGHRRGLERGRVARPRLPVPAARRAVRDARGDAPDRARDVAGRARQRGGVRGPALPGDAAAQLAAGDLAGPTPRS